LLRVLIADSSSLIADRFRAVLTEVVNVTVVGQYVSGKKTLNSVKELSPDLVLLDQSISDGGGIKLLRAIKKHNINILVMMLLNFDSIQYRDKLRQSGADFVFFKSTELSDIIDAVTRLSMAAGIN
jgi:DNA-binding NarL/FixJ family response regulator